MYHRNGCLKRTRENLVLFIFIEGQTPMLLNNIGLEKKQREYGNAKYIVFDFDGTLVDSQNIFVPIYNQLAEKHGYKTVKEDEIEHLRKLTMPERCKQLNVPLYKLPILALEFYKLYQPAIKISFCSMG